MKYSEIIGVEEHFKSAFDITSDVGEAWKTFISNEKFESNLSQIITSFTSPVFNNRKSIWIQGTYGTGKSHSLAVIKHLLSDDYADIEDYLPKINRSQLRNSIASFRQDKKVFPVVMKGVYAITDVADLAYAIQRQVSVALGDIEIATKTDFQSLIQILENGTLNSFFDQIIETNVELHSYAANRQQLIQALKNNETKVIRIVDDEFKKAGLGGFRTHNIVEWLKDVKNELQERGIADYLLIIWDEFTSLLDITERRSILNVMQDIAELSFSEVDGGSDTLGVYLLLVTHKKLEATETYKELKEDERTMAKARFIELNYDMQPTTTFHILSGALDRKNSDVLNSLLQKNFMEVPSVRTIVDKIVDSDATNASEIKEKIISLYPFHPYTSYLATFVSRVVGEAERSIFGFLNDDKYGFKKFILNDVEERTFLTADYVWDFFYNTFEQNSAGHFDIVTSKFKLSGETVLEHGEDAYAVFKTILLLNILYRVTTTDADVSEKNMVNPSTENIISAYSGVLSEGEVSDILDFFDENQILHRNPDGVFEVSSTSLPQSKILAEKKKLYSSSEDVSKIVEQYSVSCIGKLKKSLAVNICREMDIQVFWGGEKEHQLGKKIEAKFKSPYSANIALFMYRGETKELDKLLGRAEMNQEASKEMLLRLSREDFHKDVVFVLINTPLGNKRYEAYLDSLAQETVARSLQLTEEQNEGRQNAEKWVVKWMDEIISTGYVDIIFRGDLIHVPFSQCNKHLNNNYIKTIFKYGPDYLPAPQPAWKHQNSKKAVELVLYAISKSDFEQTATGQDGAVKHLLYSDSVMLFDESLNLISDDKSIPLVRVCKGVEEILDKKKNEPSINLAKELEYLTRPEYGFYQNRLFMGELAFALRPYIDRLYTSGNGQRVDKTVMKDIVVAIFTYWENGRFNDKFVVRMSTEEERALTEKLNMIFGLEDQDGLLGTKWAIREKFKKQSESPLWALKYVGNNSEKYNKFIDKMFKFSKSTDDNIVQSFIVELLEGVKTFDVELSAAIQNVKNTQCLDSYIILKLKDIGETADSLESVWEYLKGQLSGDVVFWEEDDVENQILHWKINQQNLVPENVQDSAEYNESGESETASGESNAVTPAQQENPDQPGEDYFEMRAVVKGKIESKRADSEKLYSVLMTLIEKYPIILQDINDLM